MACPRCGSWSVRADRSLAGRMVCGNCGTPLQGVQRGGNRKRILPAFSTSGRRRWRWWLLALVVVAATLAALAPGSRQPLIPHGSGDRPLDRWQ
jgi:hypothetical protein